MAFDFYYSLNKKFNDFLMRSGEENYADYLKKIDPLVPASSFIDHCTVALSLTEIDLEKAKLAVDLAKNRSKKDKVDANKKKKDADKIKNAVRKQYMKLARNSKSILPEDLCFEPSFTSLPNSAWLGIEVAFTLNSPWYSKDDRPFHVLDNPIRRDRLFGKPFMSSSSWKGLLRWACRMKEGLCDHLEKNDMTMSGWEDPPWIVHFFGNEKGKKESFRAGSLIFYPTWFKKISFEVINPHSRVHRAGTMPIYYEVVPAGTEGMLQLLYAPLPEENKKNHANASDFIKLFSSIKDLLEIYGISAKRTAGWGSAKPDSCQLHFNQKSWIAKIQDSHVEKDYLPPDEQFMKLMDDDGEPLSYLLDNKEEFKIKSKTQFKKCKRQDKCTNQTFDNFKKWYESYGEQYRRILAGNDVTTQEIESEKKFNTIDELISAFKNLGTI